MAYIDSEDRQKGLFTFYLEQASEEQKLKELKEKSKSSRIIKQASEPAEKKPKVIDKIPTILEERKQSPKRRAKIKASKERLQQTVIQMGKDCQLRQDQVIHHSPPMQIRSKQLSQLAHLPCKTSSMSVLLVSTSQQILPILSESNPEDGVSNLMRKNFINFKKSLLVKIKPTLNESKQALIELPQLYLRQGEIKKSPRPKKSLKNKLIQQALHSGDRLRIKQIREYLRGNSQSILKSSRQLQIQAEQQRNIQAPKRVFELRQMKLLEMVKNYKHI